MALKQQQSPFVSLTTNGPTAASDAIAARFQAQQLPFVQKQRTAQQQQVTQQQQAPSLTIVIV